MVFVDHTLSTAVCEFGGHQFADCIPWLADAYTPFRFWSDLLLIISAIGQFISSLITIVVRSYLLSLYVGVNTFYRYSFHAL
jgi:hypothetical protein